jgi:hypothetical protein
MEILFAKTNIKITKSNVAIQQIVNPVRYDLFKTFVKVAFSSSVNGSVLYFRKSTIIIIAFYACLQRHVYDSLPGAIASTCLVTRKICKSLNISKRTDRQ